MRNARLVSLVGGGLAGTFALVGALFLVVPDKVLAAFNRLAAALDWPASTTEPHTLFLALAVAYMYVVTLLAWQMARHPEVRAFPWVLVQAKAASAVVCLGLFLFQEQYPAYLANLVVDGAIAAGVWWLCLRPAPGSRALDDGSFARPAVEGPIAGRERGS